jgi:hypothetical protein
VNSMSLKEGCNNASNSGPRKSHKTLGQTYSMTDKLSWASSDFWETIQPQVECVGREDFISLGLCFATHKINCEVSNGDRMVESF